MMRSEYSLRSEYVANLDIQASRVLTRHACQQDAARQHTQGKGSVSLTLLLAAFIGVLLALGV